MNIVVCRFVCFRLRFFGKEVRLVENQTYYFRNECSGHQKSNESMALAFKTFNPDIEVPVKFIDHGFEVLNTITHVGYNSHDIARAVLKAKKEGVDGIFVNYATGSVVDIASMLVNIPAFSGFDASMMMVFVRGKRISIITPSKEDWARNLLLTNVIDNNLEFKDNIIYQRFTNLGVLELHDECKLLNRLADFAGESFRDHDCDCKYLGYTVISYTIDDLQKGLAAKKCPSTVMEPLSSGLKVLKPS